MKLLFSDQAWADYLYWFEHDKKTVERLHRILEECRRHPFAGFGKPEPLKRNWSGWWSRRLTNGDRLIYRVTGSGENQIEVAQCRFHCGER